MARPLLAGLPITGAADLRAEIGSGITPRNGAGSMAAYERSGDQRQAASEAPYWLICT